MIAPSNVAMPGLPTHIAASSRPATLRSSGGGVILLTAVKNPKRGCRVKLVETGKKPMDLSSRVTHSVSSSDPALVSFSLVLPDDAAVLAPGNYLLEYSVGFEVEGRIRIVVPDSAFNPLSPMYNQDSAAGQWEWVRIVDVPLNGQPSVMVGIPAEFNSATGGMGFSVRLGQGEDADSFVRVLSRTGNMIELTCSPLKEGQVIRCIFY